MTATRDIVTGAALVALGTLMIWIASGFPQIGAMAFGPDLFPRIIASGLILSGLGILLEAARGIAPASEGGRLAALPILILLALVAAFAVLLPVLGFHITAALALLVAVRVFGGGWSIAAAVALLAPIILHYVFYSVLRVPLPWGLLTPLAW